jgi:hypothetical protein
MIVLRSPLININPSVMHSVEVAVSHVGFAVQQSMVVHAVADAHVATLEKETPAAHVTESSLHTRARQHNPVEHTPPSMQSTALGVGDVMSTVLAPEQKPEFSSNSSSQVLKASQHSLVLQISPLQVMLLKLARLALLFEEQNVGAAVNASLQVG